MPNYAITISPEEASREFRVVLRGPGIESDGRRYVFATTPRCAAFAEAVNFAYEQGLRDGMRSKARDDQFLVVTGTTPENMSIRREGKWARWRRRWLSLP